jgi:hypothetical protein
MKLPPSVVAGAVNVTVVLLLYVLANCVVPLPRPLASFGLTAIETPPVGFDDATVRVRSCTPIPVTVLLAPIPPVKLTLPSNMLPEVGVKRTVTVWLCPALRLYDPPEKMLYGALVLALPVSVPPPVFCTVKLLSAELPTTTVPKF